MAVKNHAAITARHNLLQFRRGQLPAVASIQTGPASSRTLLGARSTAKILLPRKAVHLWILHLQAIRLMVSMAHKPAHVVLL